MVITIKNSLVAISVTYRSPLAVSAFVRHHIVIQYIFVYNDIRCKNCLQIITESIFICKICKPVKLTCVADLVLVFAVQYGRLEIIAVHAKTVFDNMLGNLRLICVAVSCNRCV